MISAPVRSVDRSCMFVDLINILSLDSVFQLANPAIGTLSGRRRMFVGTSSNADKCTRRYLRSTSALHHASCVEGVPGT
jgi:hypothetical protein